MRDKGLTGDGGVTVGVVAQALGLSVRSVQRLTAEQGMPRRAPGVYDLRAAVAWFIDREVERRMAGRTVDDEGLLERLRRSGVHLPSGDSGPATR